MFKKGLSKEGALIFYDASSIHTCFMRFCLDLLFLDEDKKVIRIVKGLKPWRAVFCRKSKITIEFSSKNENLKNTTDGDYIDII